MCVALGFQMRRQHDYADNTGFQISVNIRRVSVRRFVVIRSRSAVFAGFCRRDFSVTLADSTGADRRHFDIAVFTAVPAAVVGFLFPERIDFVARELALDRTVGHRDANRLAVFVVVSVQSSADLRPGRLRDGRRRIPENPDRFAAVHDRPSVEQDPRRNAGRTAIPVARRKSRVDTLVPAVPESTRHPEDDGNPISGRGVSGRRARVGRLTVFRYPRVTENDIVVAGTAGQRTHVSDSRFTPSDFRVGPVTVLRHPVRRYQRPARPDRHVCSQSIAHDARTAHHSRDVVAVHVHHPGPDDPVVLVGRVIATRDAAYRAARGARQVVDRLVQENHGKHQTRNDRRHTPQHRVRISGSVMRPPVFRAFRLRDGPDLARSDRDAFPSIER